MRRGRRDRCRRCGRYHRQGLSGLGRSGRGRRRGRRFGVKLALKLRELLLQVRDPVCILIRGLVGCRFGWRAFDEGIPLFPGLMQIDSGLAIKRETEQKKAGNRYSGGDGETQLFPLLLLTLPQSCNRNGADTIKVIVFSGS
jgi:hypothetical protein